MARPKGSNNYTAKQFIDAIPGTGGIVSSLAEKVDCDWHTAKKFITDFPTVNKAWQNERNKITDKAEHNIIKSIQDNDLQMSKWWLQVMRDEFTTKSKHKVEGVLASLDISKLTSEQLDRIISGADPLQVINSIKSGGGA